MAAGSPRRSVTVIAVAATVLVIGVAALASSAGPIDTFTEGTGGIDIDLREPDEEVPIGTAPPSELFEERDPDPLWARILRTIVFVAVVVFLVLVIAAVLRRFTDRERKHKRPPLALDGELAPPSPADELAVVLDEGLRDLDRLPVEDAIVRCWIRLERATAEAGVEKRDSETATELTVRVLESHAVSAPAIRRLLALYGEARFSQHRLGEDARGEARASFEQLRDELADNARRLRLESAPTAQVGDQ